MVFTIILLPRPKIEKILCAQQFQNAVFCFCVTSGIKQELALIFCAHISCIFPKWVKYSHTIWRANKTGDYFKDKGREVKSLPSISQYTGDVPSTYLFCFCTFEIFPLCAIPKGRYDDTNRTTGAERHRERRQVWKDAKAGNGTGYFVGVCQSSLRYKPWVLNCRNCPRVLITVLVYVWLTCRYSCGSLKCS